MTDMNELRAKAAYGRYMADKRPQHGAQVEPQRKSRKRLIVIVLVLVIAVCLAKAIRS